MSLLPALFRRGERLLPLGPARRAGRMAVAPGLEACTRRRSAMNALLLWFTRWRLRAAREALLASGPYAGTEFVSNVLHQITDYECRIAVLST